MYVSAMLAAAVLVLIMANLTEPGEAAEEIRWHDLTELGVEGKGWTDTESYYDRLPARAKGVVRDPVWSLSKNSAGLCARFRTNARVIYARWSVASANLGMNHMPPTGMSGVDLYANDPTAMDPRLRWRWIGTGRPERQNDNEQAIASGIPEGDREYILNLPLYNGTVKAEIGVPVSATLETAVRTGDANKPIVFYGTSITQGGCASRPGMAYPAIIGRWLDRPTINLGFSGNGQMEPEMAALLAELDPAAFVLDALPNNDAIGVTQRLEPLVMKIREAHPDTPILLVENISYQAGWLLPAPRDSYMSKNKALRDAYARLLAAGVPGLHYVPGEDLLGGDAEATVDGTHPTDLGFWRQALVLEPVLRAVLQAR